MRRWEDDIKVDFKGMEWGVCVWIGFMWLKVRLDLRKPYWTNVFHKQRGICWLSERLMEFLYWSLPFILSDQWAWPMLPSGLQSRVARTEPDVSEVHTASKFGVVRQFQQESSRNRSKAAVFLFGLHFNHEEEAIPSSDTSGCLRSTRHYNSEDRIRQAYFCWNVKRKSIPVTGRGGP
jgi:hypothetical protein